MEEDLEYQENKGIPVFLKVLCILTFIGAGIGLIMGLVSMFTIESSIKSMENSQKLLGNSSIFGNMDGQIEATRKFGLQSAILSTIGNALCLLGAIMMFKLKRNGYFIYIAGQIIPSVGAVIFTTSIKGGASGGSMASMMYAGLVFQIALALAFIIMYGVNLKHLKS